VSARGSHQAEPREAVVAAATLLIVFAFAATHPPALSLSAAVIAGLALVVVVVVEVLERGALEEHVLGPHLVDKPRVEQRHPVPPGLVGRPRVEQALAPHPPLPWSAEAATTQALGHDYATRQPPGLYVVAIVAFAAALCRR
jgi:hypothetical protein